uniref:Uncharacterized protein n=1 Tax=Naja naja TaxID=35670 RepID=A0A8C6XVA3_NAJNA
FPEAQEGKKWSMLCLFCLLALRKVHKACKELMQCTVLTRIIYGNQHWRLAEALANLAHGYLTLQGLPCQAMHHANSAKYILLSLRGDTPPASSEEKGTILSTFVTIYYTLECYCNLQKAEKCLEELQGLEWKRAAKLKVCTKDIIVALGRASFQKNKLDLASKYFDKVVDYLISTEGDVAPELIPLYQEIAKIKQMKNIHEKSISYALQSSDRQPVGRGPLVFQENVGGPQRNVTPKAPPKAINPGCMGTQGCAAHMAHGNTRLVLFALRARGSEGRGERAEGGKLPHSSHVPCLAIGLLLSISFFCFWLHARKAAKVFISLPQTPPEMSLWDPTRHPGPRGCTGKDSFLAEFGGGKQRHLLLLLLCLQEAKSLPPSLPPSLSLSLRMELEMVSCDPK